MVAKGRWRRLTCKWHGSICQLQIMFDLTEGIYLEGSNALLRWSSSRKEALAVGHPSDIDNRSIRWRDRILDGLACELVVDLPEGSALGEARALFPPGDIPVSGSDELSVYRALSKHLTEKIGGRPFAGFTPKPGIAPTLSWERDGCILRLSVVDNPWGIVGLADLLISKR
jgi:hypothetical protein